MTACPFDLIIAVIMFAFRNGEVIMETLKRGSTASKY